MVVRILKLPRLKCNRKRHRRHHLPPVNKPARAIDHPYINTVIKLLFNPICSF
jgi:hypothetical protein